LSAQKRQEESGLNRLKVFFSLFINEITGELLQEVKIYHLA